MRTRKRQADSGQGASQVRIIPEGGTRVSNIPNSDYEYLREARLNYGGERSRDIVRQRSRRTKNLRNGVCGVLAASCAAMLLAACGSSKPSAAVSTSKKKAVTLTVAAAVNAELTEMRGLTKVFEKKYPYIHVKYDILPEDELRPKTQDDVSTHANEFDVIMTSNYATPIWAKNGWLVNLSKTFISKDPSYDASGLLKPIAESLSYKNSLYAVPFYGESSFIMYNKKDYQKAGITMPLHPTWSEIAAFAKKLDHPAEHQYGICLRGAPGWGMNLAPLDTVINTFGGRWFNMKWQPELTSAPDQKAVSFYVNLVRKYGEPSAATAGWTTCLADYEDGKIATFYDATSLASAIATNAPKMSKGTGYAYAPVGPAKLPSGWLYSWAWAIPKGVPHQGAAWKFISWTTSKQFLELAAKKYGWAAVPPGTRTWLYKQPEYLKAAPFATLTLKSIDEANPLHPTVKPVPYTGVQFVDIPQFEELGDEVSRQISAAIAGTESVKKALEVSGSDARSLVSDVYK